MQPGGANGNVPVMYWVVVGIYENGRQGTNII